MVKHVTNVVDCSSNELLTPNECTAQYNPQSSICEMVRPITSDDYDDSDKDDENNIDHTKLDKGKFQ